MFFVIEVDNDGFKVYDSSGALINPAKEDGNLATLAGKDFATQTTLAAVLAKLTSDPATQTTLAAILAKLSSDPATQTTLAAILAKLSTELDVTLSTRALESGGNLAIIAGKDFATQTTLASVLAKLDVALSTRAAESGGNLAALVAKDFATQTTLAAVLAKISSDPATQTTLAAVLAKLDVALSTRALESGGNLATIAGKDFATQTTLAAVLAKISSDPATQTTLAAVLAKLSSDPATQTTLAAILAKLDVALSTRALESGGNLATLAGKDFSTQTTLAAVLAKLTSDPATQTTLATILAKLDVALSTRALESGGNLATLAGKDFATQTTLAACKTDLDKFTFDAGNLKVTGSGGGGSNQVEGRGAVGVAPVGNPVYIAGYDGTLLRALLTDTLGRLVTAPAGTIASFSGFEYGTVSTSAVTNVPVRATTYNDQTVNARRSIASASAADTAAGTGARQVRITYLDQTGAGPFTEDVTLNGTTAVNTISTTICFIEKVEIVSVGSGGANAGILTIYLSTAGGGGTFCTIAAGDNKDFWCHHFVPVSKICYVTCLSGNNNNASNGVLLTLRAKGLAATAPDALISDTVRVGGAAPSTTRLYGTAIAVTGPARILMYAQPEGTPNIVSRGSFDFYDQ